MFSGAEDVRIAYDAGVLDEHARIKVKMDGQFVDSTCGRGAVQRDSSEAIPFAFVNKTLTKKELTKTVEYSMQMPARGQRLCFLIILKTRFSMPQSQGCPYAWRICIYHQEGRYDKRSRA